MRGNVLTLNLVRGRVGRTGNLFQYDYGQRLVLKGVQLPAAYEVHFSNEEHGASKTRIGDSTGVDIPDEYLTSGENIHVWVYLHDGLSDGETEYHGIIGVTKRAKPTDQAPTPVQQSVIDQAIAALNAGVAEVEAAAKEIPKMVDAAFGDIKASAETLQPGSIATATFDTETKKLTFGVPKGEQGAQGEPGVDGKDGADGKDGTDGKDGADGKDGFDGQDGVSPIVTVTDITGGHQVTITDATGSHTFNIMDGQQGEPGDPTELIDDTSTASNRAWSAQKTSGKLSDLESAINDVAQEETAQDILGVAVDIKDDLEDLIEIERSIRYYAELPATGTEGYIYITPDGVFYYDGTEYVSCAGGSGNLNGFSFALDASNRMVITYTNPEDETDTASATAPSDTTGQAIIAELEEINEALMTIAGGTT